MSTSDRLSRSNARTPNQLVQLPDDAIVAAGEVALLVGKSVETLRRWRRKGIGPSYLRSTARLRSAEYRMGDVRRWQATRAVELQLDLD